MIQFDFIKKVCRDRNTWHSPFAFLYHVLNCLGDTWMCGANFLNLHSHHETLAQNVMRGEGTHGQILKRTRILNISKSGLQIFQLYVDLLNCLFSLNDCGGLECLNGFDVCAHVIRYRLELLEKFGSVIDNGFVLEDGAVVLNIDCGRLGGVLSVKTLGLAVSFAERLKGCDCFYRKNHIVTVNILLQVMADG
jgi:hypothetical protein